MASRDIGTTMEVVNVFDNQSITSDTATVGNIIDTQGAEGFEFILQSGTINDALLVPLIEDGDDPALGDATTVSSEFLIGTIGDVTFENAADNNLVKKIGYVGKKRYVRLSIGSTSTSGANFISGNGVKQPLEQANITT